MSQERRVEISLNVLVLILTILINFGGVIWLVAELSTKVEHLDERVRDNSKKIRLISEHLIKDDK